MKYFIRLDDACTYMDTAKWSKMEQLLDEYDIKPIVAIIPDCQDSAFTGEYTENGSFWDTALNWQKKGWFIALHGYNHVYTNNNAKGLNPVNYFSEFVGVSPKKQQEKIRNGLKIFSSHGLKPKCFVAPAHSFDKNTLAALKRESDIRIISDTPAWDIYKSDDFWFIPLQCGSLRRLPFRIVTGCYHPNSMKDSDFAQLRSFITENHGQFGNPNVLLLKNRKFGLSDRMIKTAYFTLKKIKQDR